MMILPKTVVLHYKKLTERKRNIINQFKQYQFESYTFYEDYDQNELSTKIIQQYYQSAQQNPDLWRQKVILWGEDALNYHNLQLNIAEISLTIKFGKVFQQLSKKLFDYCIIFEDDIILCENFDQLFFEYLDNTPPDWDAIYFCDFPSLKYNKTVKQHSLLRNHPSTRGGAATLFKHKTILDLANTWFPFNLVSDWELGYKHYMHNHKVYWWNPPLTKQGSKTNVFKSSLRR